jgi:hypothetical protein
LRGSIRRDLARIALVAFACFVASCAAFVTFDDYGVNPRPLHPAPTATGASAVPPPPLYGVRGRVSGLGKETLALALAGTHLDVGEGAFAFPALLADGERFEVTVVAQPFAHVCTVVGGSDTIAGADAEGIVVNCKPGGPQLSELVVDGVSLMPAFAPVTLAYTGTAPSSTSSRSVTATAAYQGSTIEINGQPALSGASTTVSVSPLAVTNTVFVDVTAADAKTKARYKVVIAVNADPRHYLKPSNTRAGSEFGHAVAFDGDTLVVGAPGESSGAAGVNGAQGDTSAPNAGAVYVFKRTSTGAGFAWTQQAYIKASNARANARFGNAVAVSGTTLVVASEGESSGTSGVDGDQADTSAPGAGALYVFDRSSGPWVQKAYLKASSAGGGARFGAAIAFSSGTIVVGAPGDASAATGIDGDATDRSTPDAGAAYAFVHGPTTWVQQAYVKASNTRANARFGAAIAWASGRLAVGSPGETSAGRGPYAVESDGGLVDAGAAYVFERMGTTWSQNVYMKEEIPTAGAKWGSSIALNSFQVAVARRNTEAVTILPYYGAATGWRTNVTRFPSSGATGFGDAIVMPELGTIGHFFMAVAAPRRAGGGVVIFPEGTWNGALGSPVYAPNSGTNDLFGASMTYGSNLLPFIVGAPGESSNATGIDGNQLDTSAPGAGAVHVL